MPDVLEAIFNRSGRRSIITDSLFFRLNYRITVLLFVGAALVIMVQGFIQDPTRCSFKDHPEGDFDSYCSLQSMFSLRQKVTIVPETTGVEASGTPVATRLSTRIYYQLGFITLLIQAMLFYIPHYLWSLIEGGKMEMLATQLITSGKDYRNDIRPLICYFHENLNKHNNYAYLYMICEVLNLFNLGIQVYLMNTFTNNNYVSDMYAMLTRRPIPTMNMPGQLLSAFTECTHSGSPGIIVGSCQLAQNSYKDLIQASLWLWMSFLTAIGIVKILFHFASCLFSRLRWMMFGQTNSIVTYKGQLVVYDRLEIGDWFVLMMLRKNMDKVRYEALILWLAITFTSDVQESLGLIPV